MNSNDLGSDFFVSFAFFVVKNRVISTFATMRFDSCLREMARWSTQFRIQVRSSEVALLFLIGAHFGIGIAIGIVHRESISTLIPIPTLISTKDLAIKTIQELPDSASWKPPLLKGLEDIKTGKTIPHEEVKENRPSHTCTSPPPGNSRSPAHAHGELGCRRLRNRNVEFAPDSRHREQEQQIKKTKLNCLLYCYSTRYSLYCKS